MNSFFTFNKTNRKWHLPVVAGLTVGIPLMIGWYLNNIEAGKLASLAGLSILYLQSNKLSERMILLMICCFGLMISYTVGLFFSFNHYVAPIALGLLSFGVHFTLHKLNLSKPPGNFFFIMLASTDICAPFQPELIAEKVGYVAMGAMFTCGVALVYSLLTLKKVEELNKVNRHSGIFTNTIEALIVGVFVGVSLAIAIALKIENPYWVPISCIAVMQGSSSKHIWMRGVQRIFGTLVGLGITWVIAYTAPSQLLIVVGIFLLQVIVEFLIVRNYAISVVFITILTIFLAESSGQLTHETDKVFIARLVDILIGSVIGIIGGWILYHEKVHYYTSLQLKKTHRYVGKLKK